MRLLGLGQAARDDLAHVGKRDFLDLGSARPVTGGGAVAAAASRRLCRPVPSFSARSMSALTIRPWGPLPVSAREIEPRLLGHASWPADLRNIRPPPAAGLTWPLDFASCFEGSALGSRFCLLGLGFFRGSAFVFLDITVRRRLDSRRARPRPRPLPAAGRSAR